MADAIRIIGIDPGLRRTGWGVLDISGSRLSFVAAGTVRPDDRLPLAERLCLIHDGLAKVLEEYSPDEAAVEATANGTVAKGQARTGLLLAHRAGGRSSPSSRPACRRSRGSAAVGPWQDQSSGTYGCPCPRNRGACA